MQGRRSREETGRGRTSGISAQGPASGAGPILREAASGAIAESEAPHAVQPQPTRRHSLVQAWNAPRDRGKGRPHPEGGQELSQPLTNTNAALRSPCNCPRAHCAPEHTRPPLSLGHGQDPKSRCSVDATSPSQGELTLALTPCFRGTISGRG